MLIPNDLAAALARNVNIVKMQSEGITHAESLMQLPFQGNCLNWVVGHLALSRDDMLEALGEPPMMAAKGARYDRGSELLTGDEGFILDEPHDHQQLAWCIERLCDADAHTRCAAATPAAARRWTFDDHYARLLAVLREAAERRAQYRRAA